MNKENTKTIEEVMKYIFQTPTLDYQKVEIAVIKDYDKILERIEMQKINFQNQTEIIVAIMAVEDYVKKTYNQLKNKTTSKPKAK